MRSWKTAFWLLSFCMLLLPAAHALAAPPDPPLSSAEVLAGCRAMRVNSPNAYIRPLVECISGERGYIPNIVRHFLGDSTFKTYYGNFMLAVITLATVIFGIKLSMGSIERPQAETFTFLFKVGGVAYFMSSAPQIYMMITGIVDQLADLSSKASDIMPSGFCSGASVGASMGIAPSDVTIWDRFDCIFKIMFGLGLGGTACWDWLHSWS